MILCLDILKYVYCYIDLYLMSVGGVTTFRDIFHSQKRYS